MRGKVRPQVDMAFLVNLEDLVERDHPLREVKRMCQEVLERLEIEFEEMYDGKGGPSVPPERLLMGWVLMCLYGVTLLSPLRHGSSLPSFVQVVSGHEPRRGCL